MDYVIMILAFIAWIIIFWATLHVVSQAVSLIGVYHCLEENGGDESFLRKFWEITKCNAALSLPLLFAFNSLFQTAIVDGNKEVVFYLSLPITIGSLIVIRLLANPIEIFNPSVCKFFFESKEKEEIIKLHKERFLSFFYSFICAAIVLLALPFIYRAYINQSFYEFSIPSLTCTEFMKSFTIYIIALGFCTLIVELILKLKPPVITILKRNNSDKTLSEAKV
jgi:hypothetical protein